jgi:hypothetical protein
MSRAQDVWPSRKSKRVLRPLPMITARPMKASACAREHGRYFTSSERESYFLMPTRS